MSKTVSNTQSVILVLRLGRDEFGIDIFHVREVATRMEITPIHEPTGIIQGVSNLRGQIIAMVDLARQLGCCPDGKTRPQAAQTVIIESKDRTVGVIVDEVIEVLRIPQDQIGPVGDAGPTAAAKDYVTGTAALGERRILLLNAEKIFI
jgi:purine-binding chemotaxis protein CheW